MPNELPGLCRSTSPLNPFWRRTVKSTHVCALFCLSLWMATGAGSVYASQEKAPVPDAAEQKAAKKIIKKIFKKEFAKKKIHEKLALARTLLQQGEDTEDDSTTRYVMFLEARDLAAKTGHADLTVKVIDQMAEYYDVDAIQMKLDSFKTVGRSISRPEYEPMLCQAYLKLAQSAIARDRYKEAGKALLQTESLAKKLRNVPLMTRARAQRSDVSRLQKAHNKLKAARKKLAENPDDPDANLSVGRFLCIIKGDWSDGLPLLAKGSDAGLKALAEQDVAGPSDAAERTDLADGWWQLAQEQKKNLRDVFQERAVHWYKKALPDLSGPREAKVKRRLSGLSVSFDLMKDEWDLSSGVDLKEGKLIFDPKDSGRKVLTADHPETFEVGTQLALHFRIERINPKKLYVLYIAIDSASGSDGFVTTLYGADLYKNTSHLDCKTYQNEKYKKIMERKLASALRLNTEYVLKLKTGKTSFLLSLFDSEGTLIKEITREHRTPKEFTMGLQMQNGRVTVDRVVSYLP